METQVFGFEKLKVWQASIDLTQLIYELTLCFPSYERFELASQLRRACNSVSGNIAEGSSRKTYRDKLHFLGMSYGSLMEIFSHLKVAERLGYLTLAQVEGIRPVIWVIVKMLSGLAASYQKKIGTPQ